MFKTVLLLSNEIFKHLFNNLFSIHIFLLVSTSNEQLDNEHVSIQEQDFAQDHVFLFIGFSDLLVASARKMPHAASDGWARKGKHRKLVESYKGEKTRLTRRHTGLEAHGQNVRTGTGRQPTSFRNPHLTATPWSQPREPPAVGYRRRKSRNKVRCSRRAPERASSRSDPRSHQEWPEC